MMEENVVASYILYCDGKVLQACKRQCPWIGYSLSAPTSHPFHIIPYIILCMLGLQLAINDTSALGYPVQTRNFLLLLLFVPDLLCNNVMYRVCKE